MQTRAVNIEPHHMQGVLRLPVAPSGVVVFARGSGSSRFSPRNNLVAEALQDRGFATLLFDLLSEEEAKNRANVFDISLLGDRVREAVLWAQAEPSLTGLPIGLFGASTGAAAALVAAAELPNEIAAVVSRGGRPDLAASALDKVRAPTLLVVGGADRGVIELNEDAFGRLSCEKRLILVPGATHLFEEAGALEAVIGHAADWFAAHLGHAESEETP